MNYIEQYWQEIQNGNVSVSYKIKKVYEHLVQKLSDDKSRYFFDEKQASRVIEFIERFCKHSKGKWAGKPVLLELWQKAAISAMFGFLDKNTRFRQYREVILFVARKNGKSTLASGIGNYLLFADNEAGPEIYSVATKKDQAKIIWTEASRMIRKSPALAKRSKILVSEIKCNFNDGTFKALSSESNSLDGLNVHGSLIDELHAIKDKNLYDVVVDGMTARNQPLSLIISTMGTVREGIFDLKYEEGKRIIDGYSQADGYKDETVLPLFYELDKREEWINPACWQKANPALGTIKSSEQLAVKVNRAKAESKLLKNLLCKDFNIRETAGETFLSFEQLNNEAVFDIDLLKPRYGIGGVDLSSTTDLTNATLIFKTRDNLDVLYVEQMYWIPEDLFEKRVQEDNIPYDIWYERGFIRKCSGNRINYHDVVEWFIEMQQKHDIYLYKCGYDSWSAAYFVEDMKNQFGEMTMEAVIQGKKTLSAPMKNLEAELTAKRIIYNNNPVLKWCMGNVSVDIDKNNNIQPCKTSRTLRIDGFAGLLDAFVVLERNLEDYLNLC